MRLVLGRGDVVRYTHMQHIIIHVSSIYVWSEYAVWRDQYRARWTYGFRAYRVSSQLLTVFRQGLEPFRRSCLERCDIDIVVHHSASTLQYRLTTNIVSIINYNLSATTIRHDRIIAQLSLLHQPIPLTFSISR